MIRIRQRRKKQLASIILAAGRSTRMGDPSRAKVCYPVAGSPAIVLAMETYARSGINNHIFVVGHHAEQVMRTVAEVPNQQSYFAFQANALGTGNAAACGAALLRQLSEFDTVLVVAGDKVMQQSAIDRMLQ